MEGGGKGKGKYGWEILGIQGTTEKRERQDSEHLGLWGRV